MATPSSPLLVLVHPGSACGSADFNLGRYLAQAERDMLADRLDKWNGAIVVIDGSLSDELSQSRFRQLGSAIENCLKRAKDGGFISHREFGCDDVHPHQTDAVKTVVSRFRLRPASTHIVATGCWYDDTDEDTGCVNDVANAFRKLRFDVDIDDSVLRLTSDEEEDDEDEQN